MLESAWTWNGASSPVVTPRTLRLPRRSRRRRGSGRAARAPARAGARAQLQALERARGAGASRRPTSARTAGRSRTSRRRRRRPRWCRPGRAAVAAEGTSPLVVLTLTGDVVGHAQPVGGGAAADSTARAARARAAARRRGAPLGLGRLLEREAVGVADLERGLAPPPTISSVRLPDVQRDPGDRAAHRVGRDRSSRARAATRQQSVRSAPPTRMPEAATSHPHADGRRRGVCTTV